mgnify:CR=1 FL=1
MRVMNSTKTRESTRKRYFWLELIKALVALMVLYAFIFYVAICASSSHNSLEYEGISFRAPVSDKPLLSTQEKQWAQETGVASYYVNGRLYVDYGLPSEYWEEQ